MKQLYDEYFHIPEEGKIREKVLISRVVVTVIGILVWMSAMGFTAYAYFTSSITSGTNVIEAAVYSTEITVVNEASTKLTPTVDNMINNYQLSAGKYTVTIKALGNATTGYCKVEVGNWKYYTIPIVPNGETLTFTIQCHDASAQVRIITNWGSCSETDTTKMIENNGSITIGTPAKSPEPAVDTITETPVETPVEAPTDTQNQLVEPDKDATEPSVENKETINTEAETGETTTNEVATE